MNIEFSSVLVFVLGVLYLIMLPGYLILAGTKMDNFDIIEKLTASFGIGLGVLTMIAIVLSMPGSLGLTASNLAVLVILFAWFFLKHRQNKRADKSQGYEYGINALR
jgi:uncharacterized membrane protein